MGIFGHLLRLGQDKSGNFGILTASLLVPALLTAGIALDFSAATNAKENLQAIADSASLAGAAVFTGSNHTAAIRTAEAHISSHLVNLPSSVDYKVTMSGTRVNVELRGQSENSFLRVGGYESFPVNVTSQAAPVLKPRKVRFTPVKGYGLWYKQVDILVQRASGAEFEKIGSITYQTTTRQNNGLGVIKVDPVPQFDLGQYTHLKLVMHVKKSGGCPLNYYDELDGELVTCVPTTQPFYGIYQTTIDTDDPNYSHHLFVNGTQLPQGVVSPLNSLIDCSGHTEHAWEDGGGFGRQDIFYRIDVECAADGTAVRLTR